MKRIHLIAFFLIISVLACGLPGQVTPDLEPTISEPQPINETPVDENLVTCNLLTFSLDPSLASGYLCETILESSGVDLPYFAINPQYTELTFQGYVLPGTFHTPHISVFPVQRFRELIPDVVDEKVAALQSLISGSAADDSALPLLPIFNAGEMFHSNYLVIPFHNGSGIRYLSMYGQALYPVNNRDMFYSFQGLTVDNQYWVSAILPISHPILPSNGDNPPVGMSWDDFYVNADQYFIDTAVILDSQTPETFSPSMLRLDSLVASITIQP